jgi:hypothetical protein
MPVATDQERVRRVTEEGSRRKRDLAAVRRVRAKQQRERLEGLRLDLASRLVWARLMIRLWWSVPEPTFDIWLSPLRAVGAQGTTLYLAAPEGMQTWVERRYSSLIREALQGAGYSDIEFIDLPAKEQEPCR